jgi:hypothetical protein
MNQAQTHAVFASITILLLVSITNLSYATGRPVIFIIDVSPVAFVGSHDNI